jgi:hypothetical protein
MQPSDKSSTWKNYGDHPWFVIFCIIGTIFAISGFTLKELLFSPDKENGKPVPTIAPTIVSPSNSVSPTSLLYAKNPVDLFTEKNPAYRVIEVDDIPSLFVKQFRAEPDPIIIQDVNNDGKKDTLSILVRVDNDIKYFSLVVFLGHDDLFSVAPIWVVKNVPERNVKMKHEVPFYRMDISNKKLNGTSVKMIELKGCEECDATTDYYWNGSQFVEYKDGWN